MKMISWNVNGIRASWNHGLQKFISEVDADIYAFQETKVSERILEMELDGYEAYWSFCTRKKGYSGTLCLTRLHPINVSFGIGDEIFDCEGRIITMDFGAFYFVNCYVPNSQSSGYRYDYRCTWDELLLNYLKRLKARKPVIVCGDFNVPISDEDIYAENKWVELNKQGFQSAEREKLHEIIQSGYVDSYRLMHPDELDKFTWWSNRLKKREQNRGWRLDYFLITETLCSQVNESTMFSDVLGSDHCPIILDVDMPENGTAVVPVQKKAKRHMTYEELLNTNWRYYGDVLKYADLNALWNNIDWNRVEKKLAGMQTALAKVSARYDYQNIEKWQRRIVHSLEAKMLAVRHVCSTAGGSGVDCIKWTTPQEKMTAVLSLTERGYHALPARLLLVRSRNGKQRRIHIETYYDRAMQTLYAYALDPVAEAWGDRKSFAYRKGRSAFDMHEYLIRAFSGKDAPEWVFIGDIHKCYEHISHDWILKHIPMNEIVLREFLEAGFVFAGERYAMEEGVGIGCTLSPIVANMTLDGLQNHIFHSLYGDKDADTEIDYAGGNLLRYADDIIVAARTREQAEQIKQCVSDFLAERGLEFSTEKCRILPVQEGFTFMSRTYIKRGDHLYAEPSKQAVDRFMEGLKHLIGSHMASQKSLIDKVNRKIDGWVSYHKVEEADGAFRYIDVYIKALLLECCERKHPKWSREKILEKYWYMDGLGRYCYALPDKREIHVKFLSDTLLINYLPVKTNLNPYIETGYVEKRAQERAIENATGIYRSIWDRQDGRCYYCGSHILRDEERTLAEIDPSRTSRAARMVYVHKRCLEASFEVIDSDEQPDSSADVMGLLVQLDAVHKPVRMKYHALSEYFRTSDRNSVTLTFKQIGDIMGEPLGATADRKEFWYRTGFNCISQCWLDNGYQIKNLHLENRKRVVFHLTDESKNTSSVEIPDVLRHGRVPMKAKYELENYYRYILKKYGL